MSTMDLTASFFPEPLAVATFARMRLARAAAAKPCPITNAIAARFTSFAGSEANARALVGGLKGGGVAVLRTATLRFSIEVPTRPLCWGHVRIALGLAQDALLRAGIARPGPEEVAAALVGGRVTTADGRSLALDGVLTLRQSGMGWGRIAQVTGAGTG